MFEERDVWRKNLEEGNKIVFENSHYFLPFPSYFEDSIKEIVTKNGKDIIKTEAGLTFENGYCFKNGHTIQIENPNDDFHGYGENSSYKKFKYGSNVSQYKDRLSLILNNIWNDTEKGMGDYVYNSDWKNAMIEDSYRDKDKINYFKALSKCIGFEVKNNSLYKNNELFIKRCSKSIGKYKIFRQLLEEEEKEMGKWQKSLIYIWNSENDEIRQELNLCFYYAWYWLEREIESYNPKYKRKYEDLHTGYDFASILKKLNDLDRRKKR
jgi:hypothetical protein